ncbi:hypothetical protein [Myxococcus stipitatus]|uniref:hypothetical protein n=1 Tax=Myxococcus stipitatus TaxID=83455 RepID=UPI0030CF1BEF
MTTYGYDGLGRRVFKEHNGQRTLFYWAGNDLLSEHGPHGVVDYAIDCFWPHALWEDGQLRHVVVSDMGIPHELLDENGQQVWWGEYDAWVGVIRFGGQVDYAAARSNSAGAA